ncbi:unnamed protein product [Thelazia callipaeda]|uniref:Protein kinase domain-containing protein n=1 Tax=Thelazia callipaeda TaxID=103827 RepID=A0A0N5D2K5_THECL|nr:unnamed protein product [Thelazia callipaeda]
MDPSTIFGLSNKCTMKGNRLDDYVRIEPLGKGTYGSVYKGVNKRTNKQVAIKRLIIHQFVKDGVPLIASREIAVLKKFHHPNIIQLEDFVLEEDILYIILELMDTNLQTYITCLPEKECMPEPAIKRFLFQILQGVCYCHEKNLLHRDLTPENLLIKNDGTIKIADFSLSIENKYLLKDFYYRPRNKWYWAPELLFGNCIYSLEVDVWSIGCIFAEMVIKSPLFMSYSMTDQAFRILSVLTSPYQDIIIGTENLPMFLKVIPGCEIDYLKELVGKYISADGIRVMRAMLACNSRDRPTVKQILKNPYFSDVDRKKLPAGNYDGSS